MNYVHALSRILITLSFLVQGLLCLAVCGWLVREFLRSTSQDVAALSRKMLVAAAPAMLTTAAFIAAFTTVDPLWPAQDASAEMMRQFAAARAAADNLYTIIGLTNVLTTLWAIRRLRWLHRTHRDEARLDAADAAVARETGTWK